VIVSSAVAPASSADRRIVGIKLLADMAAPSPSVWTGLP
jgi:hypothetical protein